MDTLRSDNLRLAEDAAEWVLRRMEDRSAECSAELLQWLKRSPQHIDEFLMALATLATLRTNEAPLDVEELAATARSSGTVAGNVVPLSGTAAPAAEPSPGPGIAKNPSDDPPASAKTTRNAAFSRARVAIAAAAALLTVGAWLVRVHVIDANVYSTGVGEQRIVRLKDGSLLHLNTHSRVEVDFSDRARRLELLEGEALFNVARDTARPFQVTTRSAVVVALGTQFNVYEQRGRTKVSVLEGRVRVTPLAAHTAPTPPMKSSPRSGEPSSPALLSMGEQATVTSTGKVVKLPMADVDTAVAWQQRRLVFRAVPLAEVAEEFNRYNESQIVIAGDALAGRLIWGVFLADEPQALTKFLAKDPSVEIERGGDGIVVKLRPH